ncbi:post-GPI attachment to proteins factor 3 isoform X1 [Maniola hyperantus]|uniref:post-GPI attachment to proteins factor 3 isoform X1 n=1 Tax=Aphantopus hyperantus TaxID=2795564 RepID=UPI001567CE2B|nr:post-GPI attachment to proteins factor 3 [Maniola hyperantus]
MYELKYYVLLLLLSLLVPSISCSDGDRSPFYQKCLQKCKNTNCTSDGVFTREAAKLQDSWAWLLGWGCEDECRYHCMWRTVQGYQERGYQIPKFHGKWPFRRILGVQEPASAFASVLNLLVHVHMYRKIIREFPIKDTPMVMFWHGFAWVCIHAWLWSTVFHTRDKFFTEFMDYACALSMVMSLLIAAIARILCSRGRAAAVTAAALLTLYYVEHARYLYTGRIDYDYNMQVNVFFGVTGSLLWLLWSWYQYVAGSRYVWRLVAFTALSGMFLTMELWDFAPRRGWDAHALWHLSTALLPALFYRFVIDDLRYLQRSSVKSDLKLP